MNQRLWKQYGLLILLAVTLAVLVHAYGGGGTEPAMIVSVSHDGRYAVSSHRDNKLILWNLDKNDHQVVARDANIYSAYFIDGRHVYIWQDLDNTVHVEHVDGKALTEFDHFPAYGHVMGPELETYIASNEDWELYAGYGGNQEPVKTDSDAPSFHGKGKLLNLELDPQNNRFLSAGSGNGVGDDVPIEDSPPTDADVMFSHYSGVILWDSETLRPLRKFSGPASKTHATLSPDGDHVVAVDENGKGFLWDLAKGSRNSLSSLGFGLYRKSNKENELGTHDTSGVHVKPDELPDDFQRGGPQIAVQFITQDTFLSFYTDQPFAALYQVNDVYAKNLVRLRENPAPAVYRYSRNAAIDTAPDAGVLVTGQKDSGGINVYRYDDEARSLERTWAPTP